MLYRGRRWRQEIIIRYYFCKRTFCSDMCCTLYPVANTEVPPGEHESGWKYLLCITKVSTTPTQTTLCFLSERMTPLLLSLLWFDHRRSSLSDLVFWDRGRSENVMLKNTSSAPSPSRNTSASLNSWVGFSVSATTRVDGKDCGLRKVSLLEPQFLDSRRCVTDFDPLWFIVG